MIENSRIAEVALTSLASAALVTNVVNGIVEGRLRFFLKNVRRQTDGSRFWFAVCLSSMLAAAVLATNLAAKRELDNVWLPLVVGGGLAYNALDGLVNGTVTVGYRNVRKAEAVMTYWFGVCVSGIGAISCLIFVLSAL